MCKSKVATCAIYCLLLLFSLLSAGPAFAVSMVTFEGIVDSTFTISDLTSGQTYAVLWDSVTYNSGVVPTGGTITCTVPEIAGGNHTLQIQSPTGTTVYTSSFNILPSIEISVDNGYVGTSISVNGTGFDDSEDSITITYDDSSVKTGIEADSDGSWSSSFTIPASVTGEHSIDAYGDGTSATDVEDQDFTVEPLLSIDPSSCGVGCTITVQGSGFTASETSITVTFDDTSIKSGITADSNGSWSTSFDVPSSYSGDHTISASGSDTDSSNINEVNFTIVSSISIDATSAYVGDIINIKGSGFDANEDTIYIIFDNDKQGGSISADSIGYWETSFTIPAAINGVHTIGASGSTTSASSVEEKSIDILAKIILNPTSGNVGDTITINGNGFSDGATLTIMFGTVTVLDNITTDTSGSFSGTFKAPSGISGNITVIATDANSISATTAFAMDETAPSVPQIKSPGKGGVVGFIGKTKVTFKWNAVSDPSGISYNIQVATDSDFNDMVFEHSDITTTEYVSSDTEALPRGQYYWRVRAVDGATNTSDWTSSTQFKSGIISLPLLLIIIAALIIIVIIFLRVRAVFHRR